MSPSQPPSQGSDLLHWRASSGQPASFYRGTYMINSVEDDWGGREEVPAPGSSGGDAIFGAYPDAGRVISTQVHRYFKGSI